MKELYHHCLLSSGKTGTHLLVAHNSCDGLFAQGIAIHYSHAYSEMYGVSKLKASCVEMFFKYI